LTLRLCLRHRYLKRRVQGFGRRRLEPRAEEEVHLVADEGRLVGEVHTELGLRLLQHGGERGLPGAAGGAAEDGLDAAGDLLVGHHGGSVGKKSNLAKTPPSLPRFPRLSLCLCSLGAWSLSLYPPLSLSFSLRLCLSRSSWSIFSTRAHFVGSGEDGERDKPQTQSCDATPDVWGYGSLGPCVMYAGEERYRDETSDCTGRRRNDEIAPTVFDAVVESVGVPFSAPVGPSTTSRVHEELTGRDPLPRVLRELLGWSSHFLTPPSISAGVLVVSSCCHPNFF
jgi:hypothetical protein